MPLPSFAPVMLPGQQLLRNTYLTPPSPAQSFWQSQGSISAPPKPSIASRVANYAASRLQPITGQNFANKAANLVNYSPVAAVSTGYQLGQNLRQGNMLGALGNAAETALNTVDGGTLLKGAGGMFAHSIIAPLWHGSPHAFEKFALDKIGTGEGAQAYGHGLYFAENPEVAKQYQSTVSLQHAGVDWGNDPASAAAYWLGMGKNRDEAISMFQTMQKQHQALLDRASKGLPVAPGAVENSTNEIAQSAAAIDHLRNGTERQGMGHLYQVKLDANPEDFLDWDKPLGQQPEHIQGALEPLIQQKFGPPSSPYRLGSMTQNPDGQKVFRELKSSGGNGVEDALRQAGVPGLRYFDQGSRDTRNGTRNYVVFNPDIIDILNRH